MRQRWLAAWSRRRVRSALGPDSRFGPVLFIGFLILGGNVGVWAVLLASLTSARGIGPGLLGGVLAAMSVAGAMAALVGGRVGDRRGRRLVLVAGFAGTGLATIGLGLVTALPAVIGVVLGLGLVDSWISLALNSLGGDAERASGRSLLPGLHAGFSAGAALTALLTGVLLTAGVPFTTIYFGTGLALVLAALVACWAPLPPGLADQAAPAPGVLPEASRRNPADQVEAVAPDMISRALLRTPLLLVAATIIGLLFMQDAVLDGFTAVYLRRVIDADALVIGGGVALGHAAMFVGRLASVGTIRRLGERRVLMLAGVGSAAGIGLMATAAAPGLAVAGLLLIGLANAPVAPLAFSLAARANPARSGQAVAIVSTVGNAAFVVGPLVAGALAATGSLRLSLLPFAGTSLLIALVAARGLAAGPATSATTPAGDARPAT